MIKLLIRLNTKPTFISLTCLVLFIISIPLEIYNYHHSVSSTLGWFLLFMILFYIILCVLYLIDRVLVKLIKINTRLLSILEIVFTLCFYLLFKYYTRQLNLDCVNSKQAFILIIENPGNLSNSPYTAKSQFDKEISTKDNLIIVNHIPNNINLNDPPKFWKGSYYYNKYVFTKYKNVVLYSKPDLNIDHRISERFIDSLMERKKY